MNRIAELKTYKRHDSNFEIFERLDPVHRQQIIMHDLAVKLRSSRRKNVKNVRATMIRATNPGIRNLRLLKVKQPKFADFGKQLAFVRSYADLRRDRLAEIVDQQANIVSYFGQNGFLHRDRTKWTLELLSGVQGAVSQLGMPLKHFGYCPRPMDYSPKVMPVIQTPSHSTFPSGHACEAFAVATVMEFLTRRSLLPVTQANPRPKLNIAEIDNFFMNLKSYSSMRIAARIAENRVVAGVHFPVDNAAGALVGTILGLYFVWAMAGRWDPKPQQSNYQNLSTIPKFRMYGPNWDKDFNLEIFQQKLISGRNNMNKRYYRYIIDPALTELGLDPLLPVENATPLLIDLWNKARAEWYPVIGTKGK
ncbi:MAG: phosphatase PAP2 family protein [Pseudomonadota bacterium]